MVETVMAVSCFYNALLRWRVLYFDSCFLSCLAPHSAFTVLHHLKSHVIVVNVGAQLDTWTLILLQGQLEGPGMHDSDPATLYDPFPRVPIYRGRSHWAGRCHGQAYCWSFPMTRMPKNPLYGGYVWEVSWIASVKPSLLRPCSSGPRSSIVW